MSDTRADEPDTIEHPSAGRQLRLVPNPEVKRPRPKPEPRLKELLDGLRGRRPAATAEDDAPDAA